MFKKTITGKPGDDTCRYLTTHGNPGHDKKESKNRVPGRSVTNYIADRPLIKLLHLPEKI